MKEIIVTGATVEEAVENGCRQLGIDSYEAKYEVLEEPKKGLFSRKPARVRVFFIESYSKEQDDEIETYDQHTNDEDESYFTEDDSEEGSDNTADNEAGEDEPNAEDDVQPEQSEDYSEATQNAISYLSEILTAMGIRDLDIVADSDDERTILNINGNDDDLGVVIGHRGDTLTALQYLVSLAANNCCRGYFKVSLNVKNFREKREKTLETVASKTAYKAIKLQKNIALEPMSPYERSIIHTAVQSIEGVTSWSVGENEKRHVVIGPEGVDEGSDGIPVKYAKVNNRNPRGSYNRGGYNRGGYNNRGNRGGYGRGGYRNNYRDNGSRDDRNYRYDRGYRENRGYNNERRDSYNNRYNDSYNNENRAPSKPKSDYETGFTYGKIDINSDNKE